jgi:hypothetical protein
VATRPRIPWLERESTNRDAVWLGVLFLVLSVGVPALLHVVAGLPGRVWIEIAGGLALLFIGLLVGAGFGVARSDPNIDRYVKHVSDALKTL